MLAVQNKSSNKVGQKLTTWRDMQPGFKVAKGPPALIVRGVLSGEYLSLPDQKYSSNMIEMLIFYNGSTKKQQKKKKSKSLLFYHYSTVWAMG